MFYILLFLTLSNLVFSNPLLIDFPDKETLSNQDYIEIQSKIRSSIDFNTLINEYYPSQLKGFAFKKEFAFYSKAGFASRMSAGSHIVLIDEHQQLLPREIYAKVGHGGNCCVVTYATYNRIYPQLAEKILPALEATGFNGYFLCQIGGYPNPTGREAKYAATPHAFKIPMILEGFKRGFENVLWIDSSFIPLKNLKPIFDYIDQNGCFFVGGNVNMHFAPYLFPRARSILGNIYKKDPLLTKKVETPVIGLSQKDPRTLQLIEEHYRMVELGTPFFTQLPEIFVLSSIADYIGYGENAFPLPIHLIYRAENRNLVEDGGPPFFLWKDH